MNTGHPEAFERVFMSTRVRDEMYVAWIKRQPCYVCGWKPIGTFKRYNQWKDYYEEFARLNCIHHTGDGIHSVRYSDHWAVPLCDFHCDPNSNNCHHREVHRNPAKWSKLLRKAAIEYRLHYTRTHEV